MPQSALPSVVALNPSNFGAPLRVDAAGSLLTGKGASSRLGLAAGTTTQIKAGAGRVAKVIVTTAGAAGALYDSATTGGIGAANLIGVVPATVGPLDFDFPFVNGLVLVLGAGQLASISFS